MQKIRWYKTLYTKILFLILLLSIIPIIISTFIAYSSGIKQLKNESAQELRQVSTLYVSFLQNWFTYRQRDIQAQSEQFITIKRMQQLSQVFTDSNKSLQEFVSSYRYAQLSDGIDEEYRSLILTYDYISDIYLFDNKGNLLYSANKEDDLGTNFIFGKYASSKYANAYRSSLNDGLVHFSDLESYAPSGGDTFSFMLSPIIDSQGDIIGVISFKIRLEVIRKLFNSTGKSNQNTNFYILGEDKYLRTKYSPDDKDSTVLHRKIIINNNELDKVKEYINKDKVEVLAYSHILNIAGVKWEVVGEYSLQRLTTHRNGILKNNIYIGFLTTLIILIISFILTRQITKPIVVLSKASEQLVEGHDVADIDFKENTEFGRLAYFFNLMKNNQKKSLEKLLQNEELMNDVIEELEEQKRALDIHAIVGITDIKGKITYVNEKFCEISGYSQIELIGENHRLVNSGTYSKEFWKDMYTQVSKGEVWRYNAVCNRAKNGDLYWVDTTIMPLMDKQGKVKHYVAIRTDVTQSVLDGHLLEEAKEEAEVAVKTKAEFLASMSHEIRTPMNGIIGMLGLVQQTDLNEEQKHKIGVAFSSATSLLSIINDILDFSKLEAGKIELESVEFDLKKELQHLVEASSVNLTNDKVKIRCDLSGLEHTIFKGDVGRLNQVINNILGNAIKFTHEGEIVISTSMLSNQDGRVSLGFSVKDSGIGIPENKINTLFESFSQVDASTTRKYGGSGLGLTISRRLVEKMGGEIQVSSDYGVGTTFEFYIDVLYVDRDELILDTQEIGIRSADNMANFKGKTILLVEDNITNQMVAEGMIETISEEIIIETANNGQEAVDMLEQFGDKYAFVFMDCQMPVLDGFDATTCIRESGNKIPIIAMTANAMQGDKEKCIGVGMNDYISKPIDAKILKEILYRWI